MNTTTLIIYMVVIFGFMYLVTIRPQQKQQKVRQAMLSSLRVKDKVLTAGGIYGKITKVKDNSVMLQIADKVEIEVSKSGISNVENRKVEVEDSKSKKSETKDKEPVEIAEPDKSGEETDSVEK